MPIRNPFARRPGITSDPNAGDGTLSPEAVADIAHPGFERVDTVGSKASSGLSIRSRRSQDTGEYKMSDVNDSGIYLPPSPTEREATWPKRYLSLSRASSDTKSSSGQGEIEHFSISRESFDSYRRSFDICAKTPITTTTDTFAPRQSLDSSARFSRHNNRENIPRTSLQQERRLGFEREPPTPEEPGFEDVGLNDETSSSKQQQQTHPKRRGFFSKFGVMNDHDMPALAGGTNTTTTHHDSSSRFTILPGRKRGHSGGQELGAIPVMPVSGSGSGSSAAAAAERPNTGVASLHEQEVQS